MNESESICSYSDDDASLYIGEEGVFVASESVYDSDISFADDESVGDDDESVWTGSDFTEVDEDATDFEESDCDSEDTHSHWTMRNEDARISSDEYSTTDDGQARRGSQIDDAVDDGNDTDEAHCTPLWVQVNSSRPGTGGRCIGEDTKVNSINWLEYAPENRRGGWVLEISPDDNVTANCGHTLDEHDDWFLDSEHAEDDVCELTGLHWLLGAKSATPRLDESVATRSTVPCSCSDNSSDASTGLKKEEESVAVESKARDVEEMSGDRSSPMKKGTTGQCNLAQKTLGCDKSTEGNSSFREAFEEIITHPLCLTALLIVPGWPIKELMGGLAF